MQRLESRLSAITKISVQGEALYKPTGQTKHPIFFKSGNDHENGTYVSRCNG